MTYRRRTLNPTKPTRVAEVLSGYLRSAGLADRVGQASVVETWATLVGPRIAQATAAESVTQDGTLFVRVPSSAWRQELSLMAPEILALVNRGRAAGRIRAIRWLVGTESDQDVRRQDAKAPRGRWSNRRGPKAPGAGAAE